MVEKDQQSRIRRAVDEATKGRDRYAEERVGELLQALNGAAENVSKQMHRFEKKAALKPWQEMRLAVLRDLENEVADITRQLKSDWKVDIRANVKGALRLGIEDGVSQVEALEMPDFADLTDRQRSALVTRTFSTIDRAAVDFMANYQLQLLGDVSVELATGIKRTVTQGVLTGKSIPEVAKGIGRVIKDPDAFRRAGKTVFKTAQRRATLIARTETIRAHNEGRMVFYRQVGITKVKWLTAHDERRCTVCKALDGNVYALDKTPTMPHPACRCTTVAVPGTGG